MTVYLSPLYAFDIHVRLCTRTILAILVEMASNNR